MPNRVVIRIKNAQSLEQSPDIAPREVIVYHWHRIFGVLLLALLLLGGLVWGGRQLFTTPEETREGPSEQVLSSQTETVGEIPPPAAQSVPQTSVDTRMQAGPAVTAEETQAPAARSSVSRIPPASAANKTAPMRQAKPSGASKPASAAPGREVSARHPATAILSKRVKRIHLTSNVVNDEPVDTLGTVIPMNDKGLIRVYLFMETSGLKGKALFHDWYWKGKRIAHARIPVRQNPHKAASSKFIDRIMTGPWEIKVVDEKDKVLARAAFEVR